MKYIHLELSNLIGRFERTMVQIYMYMVESVRTYVSNTHAHERMSVCYFLDRTHFTVSLL